MTLSVGDEVILGSNVLASFRGRSGLVIDVRNEGAPEVHIEMLNGRREWFYETDVHARAK